MTETQTQTAGVQFAHSHLRLMRACHHALRAVTLIGLVLLVLRLMPGSPGWIPTAVSIGLSVLPLINLALMVPAWTSWVPRPLGSWLCWRWFVGTQSLILMVGLTSSVVGVAIGEKGWTAALVHTVLNVLAIAVMVWSLRVTARSQVRILNQGHSTAGTSEHEYLIGLARRREEALPGFDPDHRVVRWS